MPATTTTTALPYPVAADNNAVHTDFATFANALDTILAGVYTQVQINAFTAGQRWVGRRLYNSTRGCYQFTDGTNWYDDQGLVLNSQVGTTYTLVLADANQKLVTLNNASAITLTVPTNASVAFPIGTVINLAALGAGQVTVTPAGGVTLRATPGSKLRTQYSMATLVKIAADEWIMTGDIIP